MCDVCNCSPCDFRCPEKEYKVKEICKVCFDDIYGSDLFEIDGLSIHKECLAKYLKKLNNNDYFNKYIEMNEFEFFNDFWFEFLSDKEKLKIIKSAFSLLKKEEALKLIIDFCFQDFREFKDFLVKGD